MNRNFKSVSRCAAHLSLALMIFSAFLANARARQSVSSGTTGARFQFNPQVELPKAKHPTPTMALDAGAVIVTIPADDTYFFGSDKVDSIDLAQQIKVLFKGKAYSQQIVNIRCSQKVKYAAVAPVIDAAFEAGASRIQFLVERDDKRPGYVWMIPFLRPLKPNTSGLLVAGLEMINGPKGLAVSIQLNHSPMSAEELSAKLSELFSPRPKEERFIFIRPEADVPYADVIAVMDIATDAGAEAVVPIWEGKVSKQVLGFEEPPAIVPTESPAEDASSPEESKVTVQRGNLDAKAKEKPAALYSDLARKAGIQGIVRVRVIVDESGSVTSARALNAPPLLKEAAEAAANQARFEPVMVRGKAVKVSGFLTYTFKPAPDQPAPNLVILATNQSSPVSPVVDQTSVYWITNEGSNVMKVSKSGGTPTVIVSGLKDVRNMAIDETHIYLLTYSTLLKVSKNGGAPTTMAPTGSISATNLVLDKTSIYWIGDDDGVKVMKLDKQGGKPVAVSPKIAHTRGQPVFVDDDSVYGLDWGGNRVHRMSKSGGPPVTVAANSPLSILADETSIYWNEFSKIKKMDKRTGGVSLLAEPGDMVWDDDGIAMDNDYIYFVADGRIFKISKKDGSHKLLASDGKIKRIAIDETSIYWTGKNCVVKQPK